MKALFDAVDTLGAAMGYHRARHRVLASNLANLDTPGYQPLDLERAGAADASLPLARTSTGHLAASRGSDTTSTRIDPAPSAGADGNAVSLEREMAKIAANRVRYATASELVSRRLALLRYAAGDGNG
jgi:flagellar basal-body rod protein FlgB